MKRKMILLATIAALCIGAMECSAAILPGGGKWFSPEEDIAHRHTSSSDQDCAHRDRAYNWVHKQEVITAAQQTC